MNLYEKEADKINIYEIKINMDRAADFKRNEMEKLEIPIEELFWRAETTDRHVLEEIGREFSMRSLQSNKHIIEENGVVVKSWPNSEPFYHSFENYEIFNDNKKEILEKYYNGNFMSAPVAIVRDYNYLDKKYFLLTENYQLNYENINNPKSVMENIIIIPKSLYIQQLLEQGRFDDVINEDIHNQLQTFDISEEPTMAVPIEQLKNICDTGLVNDCFDNIMMKIETPQRVLKKSRIR